MQEQQNNMLLAAYRNHLLAAATTTTTTTTTPLKDSANLDPVDQEVNGSFLLKYMIFVLNRLININ